MAIYTLGIWTVRPGQEEEFVEAWLAFASKTQSDFPGASAVLMRDRERPNRFVSSGPWETMEQIERWRASAAFSDGIRKIRESLEDFEAHTMDVAAAV